MYERPVFYKTDLLPIIAFRRPTLTLTKPTSRFRFNKLISKTNFDHIHYAYDVTSKDLALVQQELKKVLEQHSITFVIAIENHSIRGVL